MFYFWKTRQHVLCCLYEAMKSKGIHSYIPQLKLMFSRYISPGRNTPGMRINTVTVGSIPTITSTITLSTQSARKKILIQKVFRHEHNPATTTQSTNCEQHKPSIPASLTNSSPATQSNRAASVRSLHVWTQQPHCVFLFVAGLILGGGSLEKWFSNGSMHTPRGTRAKKKTINLENWQVVEMCIWKQGRRRICEKDSASRHTSVTSVSVEYIWMGFTSTCSHPPLALCFCCGEKRTNSCMKHRPVFLSKLWVFAPF